MNLFLPLFVQMFLFVNCNKVLMPICCPDNHIVDGKVCVAYEGQIRLDFSKLKIYNKYYYPTEKSVKDDFSSHFLNTSFLSDPNVLNIDVLTRGNSHLNYYLIEDGSLYVETPNAYERWSKVENNTFCIGHYIFSGTNETHTGFWMFMENEEPTEQNPLLTISAMYLSSFFFILVLVVYSLLSELRNLHGKVLMAYVASMLAAFLSLATLQLLTILDKHTVDICLTFTFKTYYFFLASFCWMNIMSFDIWWTFRGYAKARPIHRRGELFKFLVYCCYAFGLPLMMTLALIILNSMDLSHIPWFITPKILDFSCFLHGGQRFLYLYVPMLIMLSVNWVLFLMTAFNIWRLHRATAVLNKLGNRAHRSQQQRFGLYLKLSVVMGINWVLEVLSLLKPQSAFWKVTDSYNLLIGCFIFIIFICKKKIFNMLKKRFTRGTSGTSKSCRSSQRSARSTDSDITNDASLQISMNPKGY